MLHKAKWPASGVGGTLTQRENEEEEDDDDDDDDGGAERSRLTSHRGSGVDRRMVQQSEEAALECRRSTMIQSAGLSARRRLYLDAAAEEAAGAEDQSCATRTAVSSVRKVRWCLERLLLPPVPRASWGQITGDPDTWLEVFRRINSQFRGWKQ